VRGVEKLNTGSFAVPHLTAFAAIFYSTIFVAYVVLGGIVSVAWQDDHPIKCFYIGSSFPIWITAWAHIASLAGK